jgi:hypothetical protein
MAVSLQRGEKRLCERMSKPHGWPTANMGVSLMRHDLPGQLDLPDTAPKTDAQILADARLMPSVNQKPMDIGLFSDDSLQIDLIEMLMD